MALSGWCLGDDAQHEGCRYDPCTCPNHVENTKQE